MAKIYSRTGSVNWWASFPNPRGGQTVRRSTGIPAQPGLMDKAQLRANEMELEAWSAWRPGGAPEDWTFDEMMVLFIEDRKPGEGHIHNIKQLKRFFGGMKLSDVGAQAISGYKAFRRQQYRQRVGPGGRDLSDGTVRRELSVLSAAFNHARVMYDWKVENPVSGRLPSKSRSRLRWLRPEEASGVFSNAKDGLRDYLLLALSTGMRKGELAAMTVGRCDFQNRVFHFDPEHQKSGRHDTVPMSRVAFDVAKRLAEAAKSRGKGDLRLFPFEYPRKGFGNACERANVEGATIHTLRHTFASWMVQRGVPLREVQDLMRHASITETEKYAHLAPRAEAHYLHSAVYRPGQGLEIIDNILQKQVLTGGKLVGAAGFEPTTTTPPV